MDAWQKAGGLCSATGNVDCDLPESPCYAWCDPSAEFSVSYFPTEWDCRAEGNAKRKAVRPHGFDLFTQPSKLVPLMRQGTGLFDSQADKFERAEGAGFFNSQAHTKLRRTF